MVITGHESRFRIIVQELFQGNEVDSIEQNTQCPSLASTHVLIYMFVQIPPPHPTPLCMHSHYCTKQNEKIEDLKNFDNLHCQKQNLPINSCMKSTNGTSISWLVLDSKPAVQDQSMLVELIVEDCLEFHVFCDCDTPFTQALVEVF